MSTVTTTQPRQSATRVARTRSTKAPTLPILSTNGALPSPKSVKGTVTPPEVICPAAPRRAGNAAIQHQTHGAITPLSGPITNVSQLTNGGRNIAKGSAGSFTSMEDYTAHLEGLDLHALRRHALEDAKIVPIDDRQRLIRRLQTAWTATASRYPGRAGKSIPSRPPFSAEQIAAQDEIRRKLLKSL